MANANSEILRKKTSNYMFRMDYEIRLLLDNQSIIERRKLNEVLTYALLLYVEMYQNEEAERTKTAEELLIVQGDSVKFE